MSSGSPTTLADVAKSAADLLGPMAKTGMGMLGAVKLPSKGCGCGCEIPPPCWMPQPLGDVLSKTCAGSKAVIRLHVVNCGIQARKITAEPTNKAVSVAPASLTLGPLEEGEIVLSWEVPAAATKGQTQKSLVRIHGCKEWYFRWTVEVADGECAAVDIDIEDCPDLIHHWYDHFYCPRPCLGGTGRTAGTGTVSHG
jgi:hypothetical protein